MGNYCIYIRSRDAFSPLLEEDFVSDRLSQGKTVGCTHLVGGAEDAWKVHLLTTACLDGLNTQLYRSRTHEQLT